MSNWKELPLNDVIELVIDHRGKTPKKLGFDDFFSEGYPVLSAKHVKTSGLVNLDAMRFANEEMYKKWMKEPTQKGDVILTSEAPLGELFYIDGSKKYVLGQRVFGLRPKSDVLDSMYLLVWLSSAEGQGRLQARATGSTVQGIKQSELLKIMIPIPPMEVQKDIASIYGSLDQKIQLSTQINQTLEQIAQSLFKSWFVDFDPVRAKVQVLSDGLSLEQAELAAMQAISGKTPEELTALSQTQPERYAELAETAKAFPCEMVEIDGVEVPRGWDNQSVGDVINVVDYVANGSFATLKENVTLLTEPDYAIYVRTTDFNSGFSKELRYVNKSAYDFLAKSVLIGNEVIISNVGDVGTVFRSPSWLGMPMTLGSNAIALKNYDIPHYLYLYFSSHKGQHDISSIVTGSAQLKFNKTNFRSLKVLMPNNSLLTKFEKFALPIFEKIDANMAENLKLAEIRDLLLPRLLSGNALWIKK